MRPLREDLLPVVARCASIMQACSCVRPRYSAARSSRLDAAQPPARPPPQGGPAAQPAAQVSLPPALVLRSRVVNTATSAAMNASQPVM